MGRLAAVLELTGRGEETPWFAFLNALRRVSPVVQKQTCVLADGSTVSPLDAGAVPDALVDSLRQWRCWSYYKLRYQEIPE